MKKKLFIMCAALMWTTFLMAQNISVVNTDGSTQLYTTLADAIGGAGNGSTIYLPGGRFAISDDVKITKKVTIIGIGHYLNGEGNEDGYTRIEGNLWFNENSSSSAVMGCYITGNVNIGEGDATVNDIVIKYCSTNQIYVKNNTCSGIVVDQNYVRKSVYFTQSSGTISNSIVSYVSSLRGGIVCNNVFVKGPITTDNYVGFWNNCNNIIVKDNVFVYKNNTQYYFGTTSDIAAFHNLFIGNADWERGDDALTLANESGADVFITDNGITPTSNYHFQSAYKQYESQYGIYSGSGFNDKQLAPVPYIVDKQVASETDASGKLNIKIRVKASE